MAPVSFSQGKPRHAAWATFGQTSNASRRMLTKTRVGPDWYPISHAIAQVLLSANTGMPWCMCGNALAAHPTSNRLSPIRIMANSCPSNWATVWHAKVLPDQLMQQSGMPDICQTSTVWRCVRRPPAPGEAATPLPQAPMSEQLVPAAEAPDPIWSR